VNDREPGFTRWRHGGGFAYRHWRGGLVRDERLKARFRALAIPPAWTAVWICRHANGHIQATGRDAAGRKQYIYHPRYRAAREAEKYDRMTAFARLVPRIRARVKRDLAAAGLARERVLAAVVRLLDTTLARVGNHEYARSNQSFGLTTIRKKHVRDLSERDHLRLEFAGKSGRQWAIEVDDAAVLEVVRACLAAPGYQLFKWQDEGGKLRGVRSDDVNAYLREITEAEVTAKDFRTWAGTVRAAVAIAELELAKPEAKPERLVAEAVKVVAEELGNTPAVCRQSYIHPDVVEPVVNGEGGPDLAKAHAAPRGLDKEEAAVLAYLERRRSRRTRLSARRRAG
jgi:DNA topoisomerase I